MTRTEFIKSLMTVPMALSIGSTKAINHLFDCRETEKLMPVLFIGHGSPLNAMEDNEFRRKWNELGHELPAPKAILCISAHWMTHGKTKVMGMENPKMIYDMYGFPKELYNIKYDAPGSPVMAQETKALLSKHEIEIEENDWGFDHGCWVPLMHLFPKAHIPVYQLSIDMRKSPAYHASLATELKALRKKGVLIVGSGNIVHNLRNIDYDPNAVYDWAKDFDEQSKTLISSMNIKKLANYESLGRAAKLSVPTEDHFLPLLYAMSVFDSQRDEIMFFNDKIVHGSISMRSVILS